MLTGAWARKGLDSQHSRKGAPSLHEKSWGELHFSGVTPANRGPRVGIVPFQRHLRDERMLPAVRRGDDDDVAELVVTPEIVQCAAILWIKRNHLWAGDRLSEKMYGA